MNHSPLTSIHAIACASLMGLLAIAPKPAVAQTEPFLGQLMLVGYNFCPRGWTGADGQLLAISQYSALFSLYGTFYGGDGRTTFGLPDLRGRAPIHTGSGPGLQTYTQGQKGGQENFTLSVSNMPAHNHDIQATNEVANKGGPGNKYLGGRGAPSQMYHEGPPNKFLAADAVTPEGSGQALTKRSPYLALRWCVALEGVYPSRS